jgi:hypothetical protein
MSGLRAVECSPFFAAHKVCFFANYPFLRGANTDKLWPGKGAQTGETMDGKDAISVESPASAPTARAQPCALNVVKARSPFDERARA